MVYDHNSTRNQAGDLKAAVLEILSRHVGAGTAIQARDIARACALQGKYADRPVREAIRQLRQQGHLILSSVGREPGYFLAASRQEWEEFRDGNLRPRALDILETAKAMGQAAASRWGGVLDLGDGESVAVMQLRMPELVA